MRPTHLIPLLAIALSGTLLFASQDSEYILKLDVPLVSLDIQVEDPATGRAVTNLAREDFAVFEDGVRQEIRNFSSADTPYNILVLLDCTGSIRNQWTFLRNATDRFAHSVRPQDRISIVAFGAGARVLRDWTARNDLDLNMRVPTDDPICDDTDFYRALSWASERIRNIDGRKGVLVLSDGVHEHIPRGTVNIGGLNLTRFVDAANDREFQASLRDVRTSGAAFYFVAVNTDLNPAPVSDLLHPAVDYSPISVFNMQQVRMRMELLARDSGGRIVFPKSPKDYASLFERIGVELGTSYSIGYAPPNLTDPLRHVIEIQVNDKRLIVRQSRDSYHVQP